MLEEEPYVICVAATALPSQVCGEEVGCALHEGAPGVALERVALSFVVEVGDVLTGGSSASRMARAQRGGVVVSAMP